MDQRTLTGTSHKLASDYVTFVRLIGQGGGGAAVWHVERTHAVTKSDEAFKCFFYLRSEQNLPQVRQIIEQLEEIELVTWKKFSEQSEYVLKKLGEVKEPFESNPDYMVLGFFMELSPYGDISQFLLSHGTKLDSRARRELLFDIARGVAAGHSEGIWHSDIKPQNALVFRRENRFIAKLMDFGSSYDPTSPSKRVGFTPRYAAPELFEPNVIPSSKTDVFSLGQLFYEFYTNNIVSDGFLDEVVTNETDNGMREIEGIAGQEMKKLIRTMLQRDPNRRPRITDICDQLNRLGHESFHNEMQRSKQKDFIARDSFRWFHEVHLAMGHTLVFALLVPAGSSEFDKVVAEIEKLNIHGFSLCRVLGGYDFLLRAWTNKASAGALNDYIKDLQVGRNGRGQIFRADSHDVWYAAKKKNYHRDEIDKVLSSASKLANAEEQFDLLSKEQFVHSWIANGSKSKSPSTTGAKSQGIRFFVVLRSSSLLSPQEAFALQGLLSKGLLRSKMASALSFHTGSGPDNWFGVIKFRLTDFFTIAHVQGTITATLRDYREGLAFHTQTFAEFDKFTRRESDDGPLIYEARSRLQP